MFSSLRNLPVARKFTLAFGIVATLGVLQGALVIFGFSSVNKNVDDVVNNAMPSMEVLSDIRVQILQTRRADLALLVCPDAACTASYNAKREKSIQDFEAEVVKYTPMATFPGEREYLETFQKGFATYL